MLKIGVISNPDSQRNRRGLADLRLGVSGLVHREVDGPRSLTGILTELASQEVGLLVVNGRISEDAGHRYRRWSWFFRHVLSLPNLILAQSAVSRERYIALGAPPERGEAIFLPAVE